MDIVWTANIINTFGVILSIIGMSVISLSESKNGFLITALSCVFFLIGSILLKSYPMMFLEVMFITISMIGYYEKEITNKYFQKFIEIGLYVSLIAGALCFATFNFTLSAWFAGIIYSITYIMLANSQLEKIKYLAFDLFAFMILVPHLIEFFQYAVLVDETISAVVGILGILKILHYRKKKEVKNT